MIYTGAIRLKAEKKSATLKAESEEQKLKTKIAIEDLSKQLARTWEILTVADISSVLFVSCLATIVICKIVHH